MGQLAGAFHSATEKCAGHKQRRWDTHPTGNWNPAPSCPHNSASGTQLVECLFFSPDKRDVSLKHLCTWISKSFFFSLINGGQTILISVSSGTTSKIQVQLLPHAGNKPALMIWHSKNVPIKNTRYWTKRGSQKEEVRIHLVKVTSPSITKLKSICKAEAQNPVLHTSISITSVAGGRR